ncbi:free fatty acid receptor 3-like [Alosa pseudoharengus]|uniref:free fatty acid receptor 3-like n=1 Tax=Alosa pseudoharengus TaxID=34774 RepID=UPI003F88A9CB
MMVSYLLLSVYIFTFILGVPANIFIFRTFCIKLRHEPIPRDVLLLIISISDLVFLTILPLKMKEAADDMEWNMPYVLCPVSNIIFFSGIYTITLLLTVLAVERYVAMTFPFKHTAWHRHRYVVIPSVFFWLVSIANMSIIYIVPIMHSDNVTSTDTPEVPRKPMKCHDYRYEQHTIVKAVHLELFLVLFLIPLLICCFCYINFLRITFQLRNVPRKRRLRAVGLVVVTFLLFAVCFAPYNISHVVGYVHGRGEGWRDVVLISTTLTACLDLMIFYFSSTMRRAVSCCWHGLVEKLPIQHCPRAQAAPPPPPITPARTHTKTHTSLIPLTQTL